MWRPVVLGLSLGAALSGCARGGHRHGRDVVVASGAEIEGVNPLLTVHPLANEIDRYVLLTTLARRDSTLAPAPYLARTWQWSRDRRTLRLVLVGILWSDGIPTTSRDVVWTLDAARDPATGYPRGSDLQALTGESAPDDSTVVLRFLDPQPEFPDVLTDLAILPAHLLDTVARPNLRTTAWNDHPVGNGPFRFTLREPGRWVFEANPAFPPALGGPPHVDRLVFVAVNEPTTKLAGLVDGELDVAGILPAHAPFVRRDPALRVVDYSMLFPYAIVFNLRRPPFNSYRARLAVDLAVDRDAIVSGYLSGFGTPAWGPVPPGVPGRAAPRIRPFAPDSARRLLGRSVSVELLSVGSGDAVLEQTLQADLARAGFDVRLRELELSAYLDRVYGPQHDFQAAVLGLRGDEGLGYLKTLAQVTGLRTQGSGDVQRLIADSLPAVFLYYARGLQGVSRRLRGVRMDLRGELVSVAAWEVSP
ncbi:MAG TPA: ABC transporter substrate-binding protein [Gemmatimonadales bacterium]|nr:ABC transporter substrate-binding protein [Gemmatimonadales bacterium]